VADDYAVEVYGVHSRVCHGQQSGAVAIGSILVQLRISLGRWWNDVRDV
jgi:hypothetical protein